MPALYHFNSDQFKENLVLGGGPQQHMVVAGRLCQYLKSWQLDGLRFLYRHFEKGDSCILNDESGLGKVVTVAVFLGALLTNARGKKCLIIVHDDEHIEGWRFHLSVLTQLTVKVIERASDINYETVFLIKWSTLKNIGEMTKVAFDHIIIDNRGQMLTNKFCTGILLRYYENKTSIVISSADVTADIKLLHILLRLCGRLDRQYTDVKTFEDKFQLPKLKDGVCSKVDLEDYFLKREKVINFCREFRLRRYCHQFEEEFPLVPSNEFKRHLEQWRCSIENSQSSGSVKLLSSSSEKDIEELFQAYFQVKEERHASKKLDCEVHQITEQMPVNDDDENFDTSDEVVVMSPLLFVSESESDGEEIQLQIEIKNTGSAENEVKDEEEEEEEDGLNVISLRREEETAVNRRKSTKPVKILTEDKGELVKKESLRSRKVPNSESPSRERKKLAKLAQTSTENDTNTPKKRGRPPKKNKLTEKVTQKSTDMNDVNTPSKNERKPMVKVMKDSETNKRLKDEENEKRGAEAKAKKMEEKINKKNEDNERTKDKEKNKLEKSIEDKKKSDNKKSKETEEKKSSKADEAKKKEAIAKKTPSKLEEGKRSNVDEENEKVIAKKTLQDRKRRADDEKEKQSLKDIKKKSKTDEAVITKKTPSKLDETKKGTSLEDNKPKETTKQDRKRIIDGAEKSLEKKIRSTLNDGNKTPEEEKKRKKKQSNPQKKVQDNDRNKSKEAKEEENKRKRAKDNDAKEANVKVVHANRPPRVSLMLSEANKFINNKHIGRNTVKESDGKPRRTRTPSITSPKSPKSLEKSVTSARSSSKSKDKRNTKPLTVYTPLGVHSRSTRGMERCTRSCPIQNKYMKIAIAQVDIDKVVVGKVKRRSVVTPTPKLKSPTVEGKLPPSIPPISESPAPLESMQLGQVLSPTNGSLVADFVSPPPKNIDYNFPLMLDKDIHDTECIITSQISNNNEIIVLTGSSSTDIEMEPPKSVISRRKATLKPPMVTIPRPSYNKAKSPDLFSTCSNELSLPCSQNNKSHFEGFKIFGSELRQSAKQRSCLDILERIPDPRSSIVAAGKKPSPQKEKPATTQQQEQQHCIDDEDAMFEITSNGTFGNIVRVNSKGEMSPIRNKNQSTPPSVSHPKNRITNYLISNNANGAPSSSLEDASADPLPKTPKRRKSLSGTVKRSPRALTSLIAGGKSQSTKLTQWLVKNAVVRISDTAQKPLASKRRRLDLSFPDD